MLHWGRKILNQVQHDSNCIDNLTMAALACPTEDVPSAPSALEPALRICQLAGMTGVFYLIDLAALERYE